MYLTRMSRFDATQRCGSRARISEFHSSSGKFVGETRERKHRTRERTRAILSRFDTSSRYCDEITRRSWPPLNARDTHHGIPCTNQLFSSSTFSSSSFSTSSPLRAAWSLSLSRATTTTIVDRRLAGKYSARRSGAGCSLLGIANCIAPESVYIFAYPDFHLRDLSPFAPRIRNSRGDIRYKSVIFFLISLGILFFHYKNDSFLIIFIIFSCI